MILPDFILPSRVNQYYEFSGIDSPEHCLDSQHFENYPHPITYQYNSRGFRDSEWPESTQELQQAIWCIGDSFTVGIGSPLTHTWPFMLQQQAHTRTINVSLDGASNTWIARKVSAVARAIVPKTIVVHWTYIHRREQDSAAILDRKYSEFYNNVRDPLWPDSVKLKDFDQLPPHIQQELIELHGMNHVLTVTDEERRISSVTDGHAQDMQNLLDCIQSVAELDCNIIHSFIPGFKPRILECEQFYSQLGQVQHIPEFPILDYARDCYHYDISTAQQFVRYIGAQLMLQGTV